jgi:deoxycytidine triphosphate deaminase
MILSDKEIWAAIQKEEISFDPPLEPQQVSPSSIDLKLGNIFTLFTPPPKGAGVYIDISNVESVEEIIKHYGKKYICT